MCGAVGCKHVGGAHGGHPAGVCQALRHRGQPFGGVQRSGCWVKAGGRSQHRLELLRGHGPLCLLRLAAQVPERQPGKGGHGARVDRLPGSQLPRWLAAGKTAQIVQNEGPVVDGAGRVGCACGWSGAGLTLERGQ
ncbi:hypothetical protein ABPG75_000991 [Micractinium tetrahymenae]